MFWPAPAALELPGPVKVWAAEKTSNMGVYYVLSGGRVGPTSQTKAALRIVVLKGRAELRVGDVVKVSGSGAYAAVPPGTTWSIKRLGSDPVIFALMVSPDSSPLPDLLRPSLPDS